MKKQLRIRRLIKPEVQLYLALSFLGIAALSLLFQFVLFSREVSRVAATMEADAGIAFEGLGEGLLHSFWVSFLVVLPLTFVTGVLLTFRVAGPLHRFHLFLSDVRDGRESRPCVLRQKDKLQDFCELLNEVTAPLRAANETRSGHEAGAPELERAA